MASTKQSSGRARASSLAQSITSVSNSAINFTEDLILNRDPPPGFVAATAEVGSKAPSIREIRRGEFGSQRWRTSTEIKEQEPEWMRRGSVNESVVEEETREGAARAKEDEVAIKQSEHAFSIAESRPMHAEPSRMDHDRISPQALDLPTKQPWSTSVLIALKATAKWLSRPFNFFLTLYALNVVAWGGMLFLLLCNASPAMCWAPIPNAQNRKHVSPAAALSFPGPYYKNCNDINSPRRIWIEIDAQILTALFCVTGFGLVPWRFRDLWYLMRWRILDRKNTNWERRLYGLRLLAGINRNWFRLPGSETLITIPKADYLAQADLSKTPNIGTDIENPSISRDDDPRIPLPASKIPPAPVTGIRAPPTKLWKLDFFIWCQCFNTFFQCVLCGFMWGMNRYARPAWATGLFVGLACVVVAVAGLMAYSEGKKIRKIEGRPEQAVEDLAGAEDTKMGAISDREKPI